MDEDEELKQYLAEVSKSAPLSSDEESQLFQALSDGQCAEKRIVESKLSLVVALAKGHTASGMPLFHLIQEGNVGLINAVRKFAASPTGSFAEYATEMIEKAIRFGIAEHQREAKQEHNS